MYVPVHDIRKSQGLWKTYDFEGPLTIPGLKLVGDATFALKLTNAGSRIVVEGPLAAPVELNCCRCAEPFGFELQTEVEENFVPEGSQEATTAAEPFSVFTFTDERVELSELLRQEALAALPMQPLCRPDCKGLCAGCGANLNKDACSCQKEEYDPRWEALARLKATPGDKSKESAS